MVQYISKYGCLLLVLLTSTLTAQTDQSLILAEVTFEGLHKTDMQVASRLLETQQGDKVTLKDIAVDVQNITNIPGVVEVHHTIDTIGNNAHLTYHVEEIRTLLPIINFGGIRGNVFLRLGITDINWRGKGNQLSAYYQNSDNRHSGAINLRVPRVGTSKWGYGFDLTSWASVEPLFFPDDVTVQYDFNFRNLGLTGIYQFDNRHRIEFGSSYFVENFNKIELPSGDTQPGPDALSLSKALGKLLFVADHINYHYYQLSGFSVEVLYQNVFTFNDPAPFNSLILHGRYFKLIGTKTNLATRLRIGISSNSGSPFAPFVVDSHVNLRGVGNRIERGTAQLVFNAELRRTIKLRRPIKPGRTIKEPKNRKWASQVVVFTDVGSWRSPGGEISQVFESSSLRQFVGGGFRIIYRKIFGATLRVDYGVDIFNPRENGFIIGFGQYF
jgi:hypothetical protein